jgi:hypothetical protein
MAKGREVRAASIGYTFKDPRVRDMTFASNETLLGLDVVLLDLAGFYRSYASYSRDTYMGRESLNDDQSVRIVGDVARRNRELNTLLELGGTVVLFLPAPDSWYINTGEREYSGTGRNRQVTRIVREVQLLSVLPFRIQSQAAKTRDLEVRAGEPFATFWRANNDRFQTAAVLTRPFGETTIVIRDTDAIAGSIARVDKGVVIVLPQDLLYPEQEEDDHDGEDEEEKEQQPHPEDVAFLDSLFDLVRALRVTSGDFEQPEWAAGFLLPAEDAAAAKARAASESVTRAQKKLDAAARALALLEQRKTLFTGTGPALEALVEEAFVALGFDIEEGRPGRTDRIAHYGEQPAVLEIKGVAKSAGEKDAAQLEKWVNEYYLQHDQKPKGILVVNGWRDVPLAKRTQLVFPEQMIEYAESRGHCLISGVQLLGAWLDVEEKPGKAGAIARSILTCVGRYSEYTEWQAFVTRPEEITETVDAADRPESAKGS